MQNQNPIATVTYFKARNVLHTETLNHASLSAEEFNKRCNAVAKEHGADSWHAKAREDDAAIDELQAARYDADVRISEHANDL